MIAVIVQDLIEAASALLGELPTIFDDVVDVLYDGTNLTDLGTLIVGAAGFALAWAGIRFIFGFVNRLLSKTRGGAR
jgi:hypothetical protein